MLEIAEKIIEQEEGKFDPSTFKDRCRRRRARPDRPQEEEVGR
jgi:non-homologous end joining protein Ku